MEKNYFENREFSFTLNGDIYLRFNSYESLEEMRKAIVDRAPVKIDIGAVYNMKPKDSRKVKLLSFQPVERELVFDIDMTDYDDVRYCCKGADICARCWPFMIVAAKILEAFLREDFGFQHLLWVYSGRRGIHCWVADERARRLKPDARDAIANFINIFDGGHFKSKKVEIDGIRGVHPSIVRSVHIISQYFEDLIVNKQDFLNTGDQIKTVIDLCLDKELQDGLRASLPNLKTSADRWKELVRRSQAFYSKSHQQTSNKMNIYRHRYFLEEVKLQMCYPRLDINVTRGLNHLLKTPFSVHPKTGRVCVPIDFATIEQFDPFVVPTVDALIDQIDSMNDSSSKNQLAYKSSLGPALNLFRKFVEHIEDGYKGVKIAKSDDKMNF